MRDETLYGIRLVTGKFDFAAERLFTPAAKRNQGDFGDGQIKVPRRECCIAAAPRRCRSSKPRPPDTRARARRRDGREWSRSGRRPDWRRGFPTPTPESRCRSGAASRGTRAPGHRRETSPAIARDSASATRTTPPRKPAATRSLRARGEPDVKCGERKSWARGQPMGKIWVSESPGRRPTENVKLFFHAASIPTLIQARTQARVAAAKAHFRRPRSAAVSQPSRSGRVTKRSWKISVAFVLVKRCGWCSAHSRAPSLLNPRSFLPILLPTLMEPLFQTPPRRARRAATGGRACVSPPAC